MNEEWNFKPIIDITSVLFVHLISYNTLDILRRTAPNPGKIGSHTALTTITKVTSPCSEARNISKR